MDLDEIGFRCTIEYTRGLSGLCRGMRGPKFVLI